MGMSVYILSKAQILSIFCLSGEEREMPAFSGEEKAPERKLGEATNCWFPATHAPLTPALQPLSVSSPVLLLGLSASSMLFSKWSSFLNRQ